MLRKCGFGIAILAVLAMGGAMAKEQAGTVTLEGKIACAKCRLGLEGYDDCQSVLVVESEKSDTPDYFYVVENDVAKEFGHACGGDKDAVVTGTVQDKDGKQWITPSKMQAPDAA